MENGDTLEHRFSYHKPPNDLVVNAHTIVRANCKLAAETVVVNTPPCREQSLALTKLEEAMFWANAAIARNHEHYVVKERAEPA